MAQLIGYLSEGEQLQGRLSDPDRLVGKLSIPAFLGGGLSEEVKQALLDLFAHLAYTDADGQDYYDALYNAFYPPAELTSISAVYTQSGAVFADTPLDDLKDDLVVTAHYSDGTIEAVPSADYTLSGTLTAGTSVVTVTYEDKTTTFNVTVSAPATLSSITAVYTQSGVVYPTDSLDSLKPDLVVTAHYSDSSTVTVTTYTLSGSLTVGTSTITVTYSGKTTTFNVTVTAVPVLSSITAVYTQSGTVYDTDSLDSLKADLVVTAVYSDSSTAVVPSTDYTLSGTLTVGTSTVTVSYEGKTATFSVTVTSFLPTGYIGYDYIMHNSDPGTSQAVAKMIKLAQNENYNRVGIEFSVVSTAVQAGLAIFGARTASGSAKSFAFYSSNALPGGSLGYHIHGVDSVEQIPFAVNSVHRVKYDAKTLSPSVLTVDNTDYSITWNNDNTINAKITLFANPTSSTGTNRISASLQLGRMIIKDTEGYVINDYVPVMRSSDNQMGMYDRINDVFYTTPTAEYATYGNANCEYSVGNWE